MARIVFLKGADGMDTQQDDDPAGELGCVAENEAEKACGHGSVW